jgi:predicted enzyme related to lactoylglutathione lyase
MTTTHPHRINWFEIPVTVAQIEDVDGNIVGLHAPKAG